MSEQTLFTLMLVTMALGVLLLLAPTRAILMGLISFLMAPTIKQIWIHAGLFTLWGIKKVMGSHMTLIWHLTRPRSAVFPSLKEDADRRRGGKTE